MKKSKLGVIIVLCVAGAGLFSSCSFSSPRYDIQIALPHDAAISDPSGSVTTPALGAGAGAAENPNPAPEASPALSGGVLLPNGLLPDGERAVLSAPERYYDNTVFELIPSDLYGRVWPYIGGYVTSMIGTSSELIGICDEKGRIVCDPVFNSASLIENDGHSLYAFTKNSVDRDGGQYEDMYITMVAALDGSWAEKFERVIWEESSSYEFSPPLAQNYNASRAYQWRDPVSYDYITARSGGFWGVIGWDGSVLLPFIYAEPVCFFEGLASVLSENGKEYSFINIYGETVLGPFEAPPRPVDEWNYTGRVPITDKIMFFDGYAKFYGNGKFGLIDRTGDIIVPAEYDFITCMSNGIAMFVTYGSEVGPDSMRERFGVVNSRGTVIVSPTDYNYIYYYPPRYYEGNALIMQIFNPEGDMVSPDGIRAPYEETSPYVSTDGWSLVFRNSDISFSLEHYYFDYINDDLIILFDRDNSTWRIYDYEGNKVSPENPGSYLYRTFGRIKTQYIIIDASTPGVWEWPPPVRAYGLDGRPLFEEAFYAITQIGDLFMVRGKSFAGLTDKDGNYIIKVNIISYNAD